MAQFSLFPTYLSKTLAEAHTRALCLYRAYLRQVPSIIQDYDLPFSRREVRARIRQEFQKHEGLYLPIAPHVLVTNHTR
jgi:hypothetical protein